MKGGYDEDSVDEDSYGEGRLQSEESGSKRKEGKGKTKRKEGREEFKRDNLFLYKPGVGLPNLNGFNTIRVLISSEYITRSNPQVQARSIWGNQTYTSNSDLVCILFHSGLLDHSAISHKYDGYELVLKVTKPKKNFAANLKNGLLSRPSKGYSGNALKPEHLIPIPVGGDLQNEELLIECAQRMHIPQKPRQKIKPLSLPLVPIPETHIVFNRNNEPAYKYSLFNIADHFEKQRQLVRRLDREVMYIDSQEAMYELTKETLRVYFDRFRFSLVKDPSRVSNQNFAKSPAPLPVEALEVLNAELEWSDISWGATKIKVRQTIIANILSFKFYKSR